MHVGDDELLADAVIRLAEMIVVDGFDQCKTVAERTSKAIANAIS